MKNSTKNGLVVGVAVATGLGLSVRPWMLARQESATAATEIRKAQQDEAEMIRDRSRQSELGTELGKEELLRSQGYRKAGELPLTR